MSRSVFLLTLLSCCLVHAEFARVKQQEVYGTQTNVLAEAVLETATSGTTVSPKTHDGYVFAGWTLCPMSTNAFVSVDALGRALERARFTVYEDVVLTANYLPSTLDSDSDGLADGREYYWFGDLLHDATTDADGDGFSDAVEIEAGLNPLVVNVNRPAADGVVSLGTSAAVDYNPDNLQMYTVRSEPDGELFAATSRLVAAGTTLVSPDVGAGTTFAYWMLNGIRQQNASGEALSSVTFVKNGFADVLVAVCETNELKRALLKWFGTTDVAASRDFDGDGITDLKEIEAGSNPLIANSYVAGGVESSGTSRTVDYNPRNLQTCTFSCNPAGELFKTYSRLIAAGTSVTSPVVQASSTFAYWELNGIRQVDAYGQPLTNVVFTKAGHSETLVAVCETNAYNRALLKWFGTTDVDPARDIDGDGIPDLKELDAGTNPLLANSYVAGGVLSLGVSEPEWANLQIYEHATAFVTNGVSASLDRPGIGIVPYVSDLDGDGLFDVVLRYADETALALRNCGSAAHPEFAVTNAVLSDFDWSQNDLSKLSDGTLNVPVDEGLSACYGLANDLLVSDAHGRIWYYTDAKTNRVYTLQHRIWGGTYYGFAEGLRLATVDWDGDGDLDCLCGTADGRLFLLRDPDVGHPTGVSAADGKDSVVLVWNSVAKSFIRGYRVYRDGTWIADVVIPNFRDENPSAGQHDYRISSVSRFFKAGNSTPIEVESQPSGVVCGKIGTVSFVWRNAVGLLDDELSATLAVENSKGMCAAGLTLEVAFDATRLVPVRVESSGLTTQCVYTAEVRDGGVWRVDFTGGEIAAGAGTFLSFVFRAIGTWSEATTSVGLRRATQPNVEIELPTADAEISVAGRAGGSDKAEDNEGGWTASYGRGDVTGNGRVNVWDLARLQVLLVTRRWSEQELRAGDLTGDGKLDSGDYSLLLQYLKKNGWWHK